MKSLKFLPSASIFIIAAALLYFQTNYTIPWLAENTNQEIIFYWFVIGGLGVFLPLIIYGIVILKKEGYKLNKETITIRLRFKKLDSKDWYWTLGGFVAVGLFSYLILELITLIIGEFDHSPPFMQFEPLSEGRYWLLLVWFPYWILNILGEEFIWRGVLFPKQELAFGKYTWLIHGLGWTIFHVAFGWKLLITLLPILFIQPFIAQKTKNSWPGVILHGGLNGPSFILISLGVI
jgi:membrane protease YdiL (CAAX protease family)